MALSAALKRLNFPSVNVNTLVNFQQIRTTFVVERRHTARLSKPEKKPALRQKHFIYDTIENNHTKAQPTFPIVLRKYVEDIGQPGEIVTLKEGQARFLIMTNKAAYPTPSNLERFASKDGQKTYSSKYVKTTLNGLRKAVLSVTMSQDNPWTLEPWHLRCAFRNSGFYVPISAITMPKHVISGPDMSIQGKEFYITVTINNQEKATVRCRIHHWATNIKERIPVRKDYAKFPAEPMFPEEDKEIIKSLPEIVPPAVNEYDDVIDQPVRKIVYTHKFTW